MFSLIRLDVWTSALVFIRTFVRCYCFIDSTSDSGFLSGATATENGSDSRIFSECT